jgi:hypothetical protein
MQHILDTAAYASMQASYDKGKKVKVKLSL